MALELAYGPFELGSVVVHGGSLWHAEVPGARGDEAWSLLQNVATLSAHLRALSADAVPQKSVKRDAGLDDAAVDPAAGAAIEAARLERVVHLGRPAAVPASHDTVSRMSMPPAPVPAGPADSSPLDDDSQQAYEELFRAGTQAYLRHDFPRAMESFAACARLKPTDRRVQHNIERLKTRLRPEDH